MKTKFMSFIIKTSVIFLAILGLIICAFWYPFSISITIWGTNVPDQILENNLEFYTQLIFFWIVSIPCFIILFMIWKLGNAIKRDNVFNTQTALLVDRCVKILFIDIIVYTLGNIVFLLLGWNDFAFIYFGIAIVGLVIASVLSVASHYLFKAAALQEEVNYTI